MPAYHSPFITRGNWPKQKLNSSGSPRTDGHPLEKIGESKGDKFEQLHRLPVGTKNRPLLWSDTSELILGGMTRVQGTGGGETIRVYCTRRRGKEN